MRLIRIKTKDNESECNGCFYYPQYFSQHVDCAKKHDCVVPVDNDHLNIYYIWINKPLVLNNIKTL